MTNFIKFGDLLCPCTCRWMYWAEAGSPAEIERASMDGSGRQVLHSLGSANLYALTVDFDTQTLYWIDYNLERLEKSHTDGSNRVLLASDGLIKNPFALTYYGGNLYWSDLSYNRLLTTSLANPTSINYLGGSHSNDPWGAQAVSVERQREGKCVTLVVVEQLK